MDSEYQGRGRIALEGWSSSNRAGELDKENEPPHKKRPCLSLTKGAGPTGRFKVVSPGSVKQLAVPNPPKNTQNSTSWARSGQYLLSVTDTVASYEAVRFLCPTPPRCPKMTSLPEQSFHNASYTHCPRSKLAGTVCGTVSNLKGI